MILSISRILNSNFKIKAVNSSIKSYIETTILRIDEEKAEVLYSISLTPYPPRNPTVFLEYTINFPAYIRILNIKTSKKLAIQKSRHDDILQITISPIASKLVIDSTIDIDIYTEIPLTKSDILSFAYIPTFDKINIKEKGDNEKIILFPYTSNKTSTLFLFHQKFVEKLYKPVLNNIFFVFKISTSIIRRVIFSLLLVRFLRIFIWIFVVYNIVWLLVSYWIQVIKRR